MTNIQDIARMAGVSVTTVSRVINGHPYVSETKKEAVRKIMQQENYYQNINAVRLSTGKTFLVGVVLPFSDHPYFTQIMKGISNEALKKNYHIVLFQTNYEGHKEKEALHALKLKMIDALIICSHVVPWETIDAYRPYGSIVMCEKPPEQEAAAVYVNHYQAFGLALDSLYEKGHRRIAYCIGRHSGANSNSRYQAYRDFLQEKSLPYYPEYIFPNMLYFEDGIQLVDQWTRMEDPPSALLATSDQIAAGVMTACRNQHIQIPQDLAVIGFDNQPISKYMGITTVHIPLVEMGTKLFLQAIHEEPQQQVEMEITLIERTSG